MKLTLDTEKCVKYNISSSLYAGLMFLYLKKKDTNNLFTVALQLAVEIGLPYLGKVNDEFIITAEGVDLIEDKDDVEKWKEFKTIFPSKVGNRRLHNDPQGCRRKYVNFIQSDINNHKRAILGVINQLKAQEEARRKGEFFPDFKSMSAYIQQQDWETYLEWEEEETKDTYDTI